MKNSRIDLKDSLHRERSTSIISQRISPRHRVRDKHRLASQLRVYTASRSTATPNAQDSGTVAVQVK
jgi:hypothetical protein